MSEITGNLYAGMIKKYASMPIGWANQKILTFQVYLEVCRVLILCRA
jgi:hypothetical protein